jgi:hypothetical protein
MQNLINLLLTLFLAISAQIVFGQNAGQEQQTPAAGESHASHNAEVQSVTGCVVKTDKGFSLKTDSDSYPIETDKDLSNYVNKQVKVSGILEHKSSSAPSTESGSTAVITDIRLRMVATVIGDCSPPSK